MLAVSAMALVAFPASFKAAPHIPWELKEMIKDYNRSELSKRCYMEIYAEIADEIDSTARYATPAAWLKAINKYSDVDLSILPSEELAYNVPRKTLFNYIYDNGCPSNLNIYSLDEKSTDSVKEAIEFHGTVQELLELKSRIMQSTEKYGIEYDEQTGLFKLNEDGSSDDGDYGAVFSDGSMDFDLIEEEEESDMKDVLTFSDGCIESDLMEEEEEPDMETDEDSYHRYLRGIHDSVEKIMESLGGPIEPDYGYLSALDKHVKEILWETEREDRSGSAISLASIPDTAVVEQNDDRELSNEHNQVPLTAINLDDDIVEEEEEYQDKN